MASRRFLGLLCVVLAGCDAVHTPMERVDFGAGIVATYVMKAQEKCAAAGRPIIAECAEMPSSISGERIAAMSAQETYKVFQEACYPDLGMSKCEALVEQAYQEAKGR